MCVKLSIIVPAYNVQKYLPDCLNSILASTYQDFEILLIDDGSVDGTGEICDRFQREHSRIKAFHTKNCGLPSARNLGIENATGQLIGFVDADDLVAPDMFGALVAAMSPDVQMAACKFQRCQREDVAVQPYESLEWQAADQTDAAERILRGESGPYVWNKLYRKEILDTHVLRFRPDSQGCEDLFFNAAYLQYCTKAMFLEHQMYYYIDNAGSIMGTFRKSRTVSSQYISLPRSWRYTAEVMVGISAGLVIWSRSRAVMFYQTVLRKLEKPDEKYIQEAISYVKQHKNTLLHYSWGIKYYLSALVLCASYPLWAKIFRRGL